MELGLPLAIALNMTDLARRDGIAIDREKLQAKLGCPVVPIVARTGEGLEELSQQVEALLGTPEARPIDSGCGTCSGCRYQARYDWAEKVGSDVATLPRAEAGRKTAAIDRVLTHPVVGIIAFLGVMFAIFAMIFWLASYPMDMIEWMFGSLGEYVGQGITWLGERLAPGGVKTFVEDDLKSLLVEGVIGGVGGVLVFLPQICILFFFLSLLEDTGYLARAAFVMDRLMRRVGLPGKAFVPMISAHACAIPAVMATRTIDDKRDRLVTILILPMLSCSARIPVYAMLVALLFADHPVAGSLAFTGAYLLGIIGVMAVAWLLKKTVLPGDTALLVLELPGYKLPSLRTAFLTMLDRAAVFVKKAGTVILVASIILWAMATYPKSDPPEQATQLQAQAQAVREQAEQVRQRSIAIGATGNVRADQAAVAGEASEALTQHLQKLTDEADGLDGQADVLIRQNALANSLAGRIGHILEPAIKPLGYDWQIGIGILSSLAAREVFVSTLAVVYGMGEATLEEDGGSTFYSAMREKTRPDGTLVFSTGTAVSLLVFYVFAMQCLATTAVVRRETGGWKWPLFQFGYMTTLAYVGALIAYQSWLHFFS
jgi:ferrous iron transport protein B